MLPAAGILTDMHQINGVRDPATSLPLDIATDDTVLDSETSLAAADQIGRTVASLLTSRIPEMQSFTWSARAS